MEEGPHDELFRAALQIPMAATPRLLSFCLPGEYGSRVWELEFRQLYQYLSRILAHK